MSAAATAAGYLYASGRLRAKGKDDDPHGPRGEHRRAERREDTHEPRARRPVRIAAIPEREPPESPRPVERARPAVKVEYRTRRWRPGLDE